jgi:antitoxin (DNA-binding transcriptional repressor) of toxin-antitoxin stability system
MAGHTVKTHHSRIVEEVPAGSEVTIAKAGRPLAKKASRPEEGSQRP